MVMRRSEFVLILLTAAVVFFVLGYFVSGMTGGQSFTVSAENAAYAAGSGSSAPAEAADESAEAAGAAALNINSASAEELAALPGVERALAEKIVSYREIYGPFDYPERLLRVSGIDRELFLAIEQYIYAG